MPREPPRRRAFFEWLLPAAACVFVFASIPRQMKNFFVSGLLFFAIGVFRLQQDVFHDRAALAGLPAGDRPRPDARRRELCPLEGPHRWNAEISPFVVQSQPSGIAVLYRRRRDATCYVGVDPYGHIVPDGLLEVGFRQSVPDRQRGEGGPRAARGVARQR